MGVFNLSTAVVSVESSAFLSRDINATIAYHKAGVEKLSQDISAIINDISNSRARIATIRSKIHQANGKGVQGDQAKIKIIETSLYLLTTELSKARYNKEEQERLLNAAEDCKARRIAGAYMIKRAEERVQAVTPIIRRGTSTTPVKPFVGIKFSLTNPDFQGWKLFAKEQIKQQLFA